jgi:hypothetical protein
MSRAEAGESMNFDIWVVLAMVFVMVGASQDLS